MTSEVGYGGSRSRVTLTSQLFFHHIYIFFTIFPPFSSHFPLFLEKLG